MRGLRLRSRNRISALAGRSSHAYDLWIARDEPAAIAAQKRWKEPAILVVVDCQEGAGGLDDTLASIVQAGSAHEPILIGAAAAGEQACIEHASDLSPTIDPRGSWLCVISAGDRLARGALEIYSAAAADADRSCLIYSDDDLIGVDGSRSAPQFKPCWNPELFESHDYISGSAIVKADAMTVAALPKRHWASALIKTALNCPGKPIHLPVVLHHRRTRPAPKVPARPSQPLPDNPPSVTVIVPTRNHVQLLRTCIDGVRRTEYPAIETIVIDNGSDDPETIDFLQGLDTAGTRVLRIAGPFNYSALNNAAVAVAGGEVLCFLNNDIEMIAGDWLSIMVRQALRADIGAVGARLLYRDGTVQHAGVYTGIGGGAGHAHRYQDAEATGYFERARLPQRISAVTGACLVVAKEKFLAVGGFDEKNFPVAFNDVDLCLKLNARGWQSFYEPRATLIHHESKSRGSDSAKGNRARFADELAALKRIWATDIQRDPYHHPHLSPFCEQFLISV